MNKKLTRVVIKEELVDLLGDFKKALVLNQMIYWSQRVKDFDDFIKEENLRTLMYSKFQDENIPKLKNGWIYKTAKQLSRELLNSVGKQKVGLILIELEKLGYLQSRRNPLYEWDRTKHYRLNIALIQSDLLKLGYALEGYRIPINPISEFHPTSSKTHLTITETTSEITCKEDKSKQTNNHLQASGSTHGSSKPAVSIINPLELISLLEELELKFTQIGLSNSEEELSTRTKRLSKRLQHNDTEYICSAIDNYCFLISERNYRYDMKYSLAQLLTIDRLRHFAEIEIDDYLWKDIQYPS